MSERIVILDGGMGTTLEDSGYSVSSKLWSSDPALHEAVQSVHEGFLKAGADIIGTATYQACESLYLDNGYSSDQACEYMRGAVDIAGRAISSVGTSENQKIGLCLGPFGGTLSPGQEYSGVYPPPYGPQGFQPGAQNINRFEATENGQAQAAKAKSALRDFHLSRLQVFAAEEATWRTVDWIMFETIPLRLEGEAIRSAMEELYRQLADRYQGKDDGSMWWKKPYWTSFVFPEGKAPDASPVSTIVKTMYSDLSANSVCPTAIGINCTSPAYVQDLTRQMTETMSQLRTEADEHSSLQHDPPAFVLYPDGGLVYDVITRTWHTPKNAVSSELNKEETSWSKNVGKVARWAAEQECVTSPGRQPVWRQIMVGGCCKAGYEEIAGLRAELK
ncbi:hypothetical protein QFC22_005442 [Naganishia vaughanmartiniae]|uniref:Uncharacterized protein n=1 Tax=Naganishia vaughanmartiniae TaxID=1424756 RepID=A0ACC2WX66_9TREE|nr:hypothetical protein QFC22_005442 [Naganishia vaughanmartiniae]